MKVIYLSSNTDSVSTEIYSIELDWTPSITPGILQYNIYRSLVSGGPYTLIGTAPPYNNGAVLAYVDFAVFASTTYYYVVTSFDGTNESIVSNEAAATTRV